MKITPSYLISTLCSVSLLIGGCGQYAQSTYRNPDPSQFPSVEEPFGPERVSAAAPSHKDRKEMALGVLNVLHQNISTGKLNYRFNVSGEGVVLATAGLAFIATGSNLSGGPYKKSLDRIYNRLQGIVDGHQFERQPTWGATQSLVFLAELHRTSLPAKRSQVAQYVQKYVNVIQDGQSADGAWTHGFNDKSNTAGYSGLVATTVMALQGLGMARREGAAVKQDVIDRALAYVNASSDLKRGHIGYSTRGGQKGMGGPGRTAGGLLGLIAVDQQETPLFAAADRYVRKSLKNATVTPSAIFTLQGGHASAQMGLAWAAWYAAAMGDYEDFWQGQGAVISSRRLVDGGFSAAPSDGKANQGQHEQGDFANAWHALILVADSPFLQIGELGVYIQALKKSASYAKDLITTWEGEVPSELTALAALPDQETSADAGDYAKALQAAVRKLSREKDLDSLALVKLLQLAASGTAQLSADGKSLEIELTVERSLLDGAAKLKATFEPVEGDKSFRKKSLSANPNFRDVVNEGSLVRLARGATAPTEIQVHIEWSIGSKKHAESLRIPVASR